MEEALYTDPFIIKFSSGNLTNKDTEQEWIEDQLYYNKRVYIPESLQMKVLKQYYNILILDYFDQWHTELKIKKLYYWLYIKQLIKDYINAYNLYNYIKA